MSVYTIKTMYQKTFTFPVMEDIDETVIEFKNRIFETIKVDDVIATKDKLILVQAGKVLSDNEPIINYKKDFIVAVFTKKNCKQSTATATTTTTTTTTASPTTSQTSASNNNNRFTNNNTSSTYSPSPSINPFANLFSENAMTSGNVPVKYLHHQNDVHAANALAEIFNDNSQITNLIRNTNYFNNLSQVEQTSLLDEMENNVMPQNLRHITKFLIDDHQTFTATVNNPTNILQNVSGNSAGNENLLGNLNFIQFLQTLGANNIIPIGMGGYNQVSQEQRTKDIDEIKSIVGPSYTDTQIEQAYAICGNDVNSAINFLLSPEDEY